MENNTEKLMAPPTTDEERRLSEIFQIRRLEVERQFKIRTMITILLLYLAGISGIIFSWWWYYPKWNPPNIDPHINVLLMAGTGVGVIALSAIWRLIDKIACDKFHLQKLALIESGRKLVEILQSAREYRENREQVAEKIEDILNNYVLVKRSNGKNKYVHSPLTTSDIQLISSRIAKNGAFSTTPLPNPEEP